MKKLLDRYYVVLYRGYEAHKWLKRGSTNKETSGLMAFTLALNIISIIRLIDDVLLPNVNSYLFVISIIIMTFLIDMTLSIVYNKERRYRLLEKYENESSKSRRLGVLWVIIYQVLSFALFVLPIFIR